MKVKNISTRTIIIDGKPLPSGESAVVSDNVDIAWFLSMGKVRVEGLRLSEKSWDRKVLEKMKMAELRKIGNPLGAKDTSKEELIEEILKSGG